MRKHILFLATATLLAGSSVAGSQQAATLMDVPPVPQNLVVPSGHQLFFKGSATGTQNYICLPLATGAGWTFLGPQATLYLTFKGALSQQMTTHFLAANPAENGTYRPSWLHSFDSSQVWARAVAASTDPAYVQPGAIPWLLLRVVGAQYGPTGGSFLADTVFIQRVNTSGGAAPSTGCASSGDVGRLALVPYTTDYYFYKAER